MSKLRIPGTAWNEYTERPEVNLVDGRFYSGDMHGALRWMRQHEPLYHDQSNDLWAVTRHADIMFVSKNAATFGSRFGFRPDAPALPMMISMDRPEHMLRRNLVNRGFTPRRVQALEGRIREICTHIINAIIERGECDFVSDIAAPLPLIVIADLLGVKEEDHKSLLRWSDDLMVGLGTDDPKVRNRLDQAFVEYSEYHRQVVSNRRMHPGGDDLMSILVHAELDGQKLDDDSLLMESLLILIGGDETTRHVLSGGMHQLLLHPEQMNLLCKEPKGIPFATEEMLRWVTPIHNMMRTVLSDTTLAGQAFKQGDRLLLMYPSANRDEAVFDQPYQFNIKRDPNPHVAFGGYGNHFCLGNSLARLELRVMFEELLRRIPDISLANQAIPKMRGANFVGGIESLPVCFTPARKEAA